MNKQEATQILQQALSQVKATVQEHNLINQALIIITNKDEPKLEDLTEKIPENPVEKVEEKQ